MRKKRNLVLWMLILSCFLLVSCGGAPDIATAPSAEKEMSDAAVKEPEAETSVGNDTQSAVPETLEIESSAWVSEAAGPENPETENEEKEEPAGRKMRVQVGDYHFTATLEDNTAVEELREMMKEGPVTIQMDDYSGFEKVGSLGRSLTASDSQTTTNPGDIVLYNGNKLVVFYGSNSWSYTRIGRIDDLTEWEKALGSGSVTVVFAVEE